MLSFDGIPTSCASCRSRDFNGQRHADQLPAAGYFRPRVIDTICDPRDIGSLERVVTRNNQDIVGDALGLRTIARVAIVRRRYRSNVFVWFRCTNMVFLQALGQLVTLRRGRKQQRVLKPIEVSA
jgi:hypothetical protein